MKASIKIGKLFGIEVFLHWTFLLLILWIIFTQIRAGANTQRIVLTVSFILLLFVCITFHELGHALTAKRYGIKTKHILLLPVGGVALLERIPEKPGQELLVAIAGPLVNIIIAGVLFVFLYATGQSVLLVQSDAFPATDNFLQNLLAINLMLALFNLIPAFPMDGGRVLRALLSFKLSRLTATVVAARIGQAIAIVFVIWGLLFNPLLLIIGIFIFFAARTEAVIVESESLLKDVTVSDVMMKEFHTLSANDTLETAAQQLLNSQASSFLITENAMVTGALSKKEIISHLSNKDITEPVKKYMNNRTIALQKEMLLDDIYKLMADENIPILPVYENGALIGAVDTENIAEYMMIQQAEIKRKSQPASPLSVP
ncbi:MAG: site-2 protease family protein [Chitinophagaceae bacterium]|nr:site-2 protease family protein [Chitinophagaceae bacterium]